jgi:hypothetical protein
MLMSVAFSVALSYKQEVGGSSPPTPTARRFLVLLSARDVSF